MSDDEKPEFKVSWPEGTQLRIDKEHLFEMRKALETQFKYIIYKQPGFNKFHSMGKTNFFQHFRTPDGIDFGVCNLYWDKDANDNIDYADEYGNIISKQIGGWCVRWFTKAEFDAMGHDNVVGDDPKEDEFAESLRKVALANLKKFQKKHEERKELEDWMSEAPPKFLN